MLEHNCRKMPGGDIPLQPKNGETTTFLGGNDKLGQEKLFTQGGCCRSKHTKNCCLATCIIGAIFILLAIVVLASGALENFLSKVVLSTMPLKPDSDRYNSWLNPPVQAKLTGYAFNVTNPNEVIAGMKPKLQEVGPFVYKAVTVKDSRDSLVFNDDGETLTYKPRKFYFLDTEESVGNPDETFITVPNIPLITALSSARDKSGFAKQIMANLVLQTGRGTPFIDISFTGLLWGYEDKLPCVKIPAPDHCPLETEDDGLSFEEEAEESADDWFDEEWKRKKRSVMEESAKREKRSVSEPEPDWEVELRDGPFEDWEHPKGGYVNCSCIWGLFRDRNVTLRKPVRIHHGMADMSMKGWVKEFDDSPTLNWWQEGSECDKLGGFDGATLPPGLGQSDVIDMFISLMCRKIDLKFEKEVLYQNNLVANRYIPPLNALGSHLDSDPSRRNEKNACYCVDGFSCMKSGVLNMGPCKRTPSLPTGAPMALSYPHFYQADKHYLDAVEGLNPDKEQHQFYLDLNPELGIPLAIRPRFQLNVIINRDEDIPILSKFQRELVLPFLWAQDGFDTPSPEMADAIRLGLDVPAKGKRLVGVVLLALGAGMLISSLVWILWYLRPRLPSSDIPAQ